MPNRDGFMLPDPRPDAQPVSRVACMKDCDVPTQIIGKARDIDVTPEDESQEEFLTMRFILILAWFVIF